MEELIIDLYNKYAPGQLSQDKINYIKTNYGGDMESFVKDFYGKYAPSVDANQKWSYIQENYLKKKDEAFPLSSGQESILSDINYMGTDGQLAPSPERIGVPRIDERGYTAAGDVFTQPAVPPVSEMQKVMEQPKAPMPEKQITIESLGQVGEALKPYLPENFESLSREQKIVAMQDADAELRASGTARVFSGAVQEMGGRLLQVSPSIGEYFLSDEKKELLKNLPQEDREQASYALMLADEETPVFLKSFIRNAIPSATIGSEMVQQGKEESAKVFDKFDQGVTDYLLNGDFSNAGKLAYYQIIASSPTFLEAMVPGGMAAIGLQSFAGFTMEDVESGKTLSASDFLNNITKSGAEAFFETYTAKIGKRVFSSLIGKEAASNAAAKSMVSEILKGFGLGALEEGGSEAATAATQLLSDAIFAGREVPIVEAMKQISDAFIVGGLMGGPLSAVGAGVSASRKKVAAEIASKQDKDQLAKNASDKINLIAAKESSQDESVSSTIDELIARIDKNSAEIEANLEGIVDNMTDEEVADIVAARKEVEQLAIKAQQLKDNPNIDDAGKETALALLKQQAETAIQKRQTIIDNAVQKQTTSEVPVQPKTRVGEEVAEGAPKTKPEVVTEEGVQEEEVTKVSDALSEMGGVYYMDGQKGEVKTIGQTVVFETADRIFDIGNIDEVSNSTIESFGINKESELDITLNDDNSVTINGTKYLNRYSDPNAAISVDKDGNYSVNLETEGGQKRTFRGQRADQIVYQITLKNFENNATTEQTESAIQYADEAIGAQEQAREAAPKREGKGVGKVTQEQIEVKEKKDVVSETIQKTSESLKVTFPGVDVVVGENEADTKAKIVEKLTPLIGKRKANAVAKKFTGAAGQAIFAGGKPVAIVIDKESANARTAGHEAWEVMLNEAFGNDPAAFEDFRNSIDRQLRLNGFEDIANELQRFSEQYSDEGNEAVFREYMAEFGGMLVEGGFDPANLTSKQKSFLEKVKEILNKFAKELIGTEIFLKDATPENIIDFMATISKKVAKGEGVAEFFVREDGFGDEPSQITAFSQLSNKQKKKYEESLKKRRPDLVASGLVDSVVSEIEKFGEENSVDGTGNRRLEDLAAHYIYNGNVILPEDGYKVLEANRLAKANKVDPFSFKDPLLLIEKYEKFTKKGKVDPDNVPEFKDKKTIDEYGLSIYTVDDTKEGQAAVRAAIDADFGENANPWCLAARQNGTLNTAWSYWNRYNEYPKKIAFRNGKLVAFSANDAPYEVWWDKQDNPGKGIEVKKKIDSNTTQDIYVNLEGKIVEEGDVIKKEKTKNNNGDSVEKITRIRQDRSGDEKNFVNGKRDGESIYYYNIDDKSIRRISNFKDNALDGEEKIFRRDNTLESLQTYKDGKLNGPHLKLYPDGSIGVSGQYKDNFQVGTWNVYQMNGLKQSIRNYDGKGRLNGESKQWYDNGNLISISNYKNGQRAGKQESWHENGQKRTEKYFLSTGSWTNKTWYENGQLESEKSYKDGELNGPSKTWKENGFILTDENYKNGYLHGIKKTRNIWNGQLIRSEEYKNGKIHGKVDSYDGQGTLLSSETIIGSLFNGPAEYFYEDGKKNSEVNFYDGALDGNVKVFNNEGVVQFDGKYSNGLLDGIQKYFNDNGQLEKEQLYKNGKLIKETIYNVPVNSLREELSGREGVTDQFIDALYRSYSEVHAREVNERWIDNNEIDDVIEIDNIEQRSQKKPTKREVLSTEYLREKLSSIVSKYNEAGAIKKRQKELVDISAALKDQLRAQAKSAREAIKFVNSVRKNIAEAVNQMEKSKTISSVKARAIINKMSRVNLTNPVAVDRLIDYIEKVFSDAKYVEKSTNANKLRRAIKNATKSDRLQANQRAIAKQFLKIDPNLVEDIDAYLEQAESVYNAVKKSRVGVSEGGADPNLKQAMNFEDVSAYIDEEIKKQEQIKVDMLLALNQDLVDAGVLDPSMSLESVKYLIDSIKDKSTKADEVENKKIVRDYIRKAFDAYSTLMRQAARENIDPFTGEELDLTDEQRSLAMKFAAMDTDMLGVKDAIDALDAMNNFLTNGTIDGMAGVVQEYEGKLNAARNEKIFKASPIRWFGNENIGRVMFRNFGQIQLVFEAAFKDPVAWTQIARDSGFYEFTKGKTNAHLYAKAIVDNYNEKFKHIPDFHSSENTYERGIYSIMLRTPTETVVGKQKEFDRQKKLVIDSILGRLDYGTNEQRKAAQKELDVYNKILRDSNNIDELSSKVSDFNKEAVAYWIEQYAKKFDDFQETSRSVRNTILSRDFNYTPQRFTTIGKADSRDTDMEDITFIQNGQFFYDNVAGSFMERNPNLTSLPIGSNKIPTRGLNLEFDTMIFNSFLESMVDSETAGSVKKMNGYFNSEGFAKMVNSSDDRTMLTNIIKEFVSESKKGNYIPATELREITRWLDYVSSLGTARALASITQSVLQTVPVMANTLINSGRFDYKGFKSWNKSKEAEWLKKNGHEIAVRGLTSRADVQAIKSLIKIQEEGKAAKFARGLRDWNEKALESTLGNFDKWVAELSWISYYKQNLESRGIDTSDIDWETHESDQIAASYAQAMVNRNQNISDIDQIGKVFKDQRDLAVLVRKMAFAFASFGMNQKVRMAVDAKVLRNRDGNYTQDQKARAIRSLAATSAEMAIYRGLQIGLSYVIYAAGGALMNWLGDDDEADRLAELYPDMGYAELLEQKNFQKFMQSKLKYAGYSTIYDVMSPIPLTDPAIAKLFNLIIDATGGGEEWQIQDSESNSLRELGTYGVAGDKVMKAMEMFNLAMTGKYTYKSRSGKETMYISKRDMEAEAIAATAYTLYAFGIIPETLVGKLAAEMHRRIRKNAVSKPDIYMSDEERLQLEEQTNQDMEGLMLEKAQETQRDVQRQQMFLE